MTRLKHYFSSSLAFVGLNISAIVLLLVQITPLMKFEIQFKNFYLEIILISILILKTLISYLKREIDFSVLSRPINFLPFIFYIFLITHINLESSFIYFSKLTYSVAIFYLIIINFKTADLDRYLNLIQIGVFILAAWFIVDINLNGYKDYYQGRLQIGFILGYFILVNIYDYFSKRQVNYWIYSVCIILLVMSTNRTSIILVFLAILFLGLYYKEYKKMLFTLSIFVLTLFLFISIPLDGYEIIRIRLINFFDIAPRLEIYNSVLSDIYSGEAAGLNQYSVEIQGGVRRVHPHNFILQIAAEIGIISAFFVALYFFIVSYLFIKNKNIPKRDLIFFILFVYVYLHFMKSFTLEDIRILLQPFALVLVSIHLTRKNE